MTRLRAALTPAIGRGIRHLRSAPQAVWLTTALFVALAGFWSLLAPMTRAPDEVTHFDLIDHMARTGRFPDYDGRMFTQAAWTAGTTFIPSGPYAVATGPDDAAPRGQRPRLEDYGPMEPSTVANQMPQHPPLYYVAAGRVLAFYRWLAPADAPLDQEWHVLRLFSILLMTPVPFLAWSAARGLGAGDPAGVFAVLLVVAVPQVVHIGSTINNDNLVVVLAALTATGVARVLRGSSGLGLATVVGLSAGAALATKANAVVLVPWVGLAYLVQWLRGSSRVRTVKAAVTALGCAAMVGGAWPLRNLVRHGELFPSTAAPTAKPAGSNSDLWYYLTHQFVPKINQRFWGSFGYYDADLTRPLALVASVVLGVAALTAIWCGLPARGRGSRGSGRVDLIAFASLVPLVVVTIARRAYSYYVGQDRPPFMQGRYLYVALVPLMVVAAVGLVRLASRWAALGVLGAATILHGAGAWAGADVWWAEPGDPLSTKVASVVAWSPWPPWTFYVTVTAVAVIGAGLALELGRGAVGGAVGGGGARSVQSA